MAKKRADPVPSGIEVTISSRAAGTTITAAPLRRVTHSPHNDDDAFREALATALNAFHSDIACLPLVLAGVLVDTRNEFDDMGTGLEPKVEALMKAAQDLLDADR